MTANAGRADYNPTIRDPLLAPGEPMFRLRGQDALAAHTIRYWASMAHSFNVDPAVIEQALRQADAFDAWPDQKLPDAEHLTENERKQLAYALRRRAWRAAVPTISATDIFVAELRGDARRVDPETCKHAAWSFDAHGRLCPDCGTEMVPL